MSTLLCFSLQKIVCLWMFSRRFIFSLSTSLSVMCECIYHCFLSFFSLSYCLYIYFVFAANYFLCLLFRLYDSRFLLSSSVLLILCCVCFFFFCSCSMMYKKTRWVKMVMMMIIYKYT